MAIKCPNCGAEFDVTLFTFDRRIHCDCGAWVDMAVGHQQMSDENSAHGTSVEWPSDGKRKPNSSGHQRRFPGWRHLSEQANSHWGYEDPVYRFYQESMKLSIQFRPRRRDRECPPGFAPHLPLDSWFYRIVEMERRTVFTWEVNERWSEAYLGRFSKRSSTLDTSWRLIFKYGKELEEPPDSRCRAAGQRCCTCTGCGDHGKHE